MFSDAAEPTRRLRLRWGSYRERSVLGLCLIVGGLVHLQAASAQSLVPLLVGTVAHTIGWWLMPSSGWRRNLVVIPSGLAAWLLLIGPQATWLLVVPSLSWLLVRHRPARSYPTALAVLGCGIVSANLFHEYGDMPVALGMTGLVAVAAAWGARMIAAGARIHSQSGERIR